MRAGLVVALLAIALPLAAQNPFHAAPKDDTTPTAARGERTPTASVRGSFVGSWSHTLQQSIASLSRRVRDGDAAALILSVLASALFGIVHILGPGHGKAFAVSYFGGRKARIRDGLTYSAAVNVMDSISASVFVVLGYLVLSRVFPALRVEGPRVLRLISYGFVALMGIGLLVSHAFSSHDHSGHTHAQPGHAEPGREHQALPWGLALSVGLVPCPVSTVLLVYGIVHGVLPLMFLMVAGVTLGGFIAMSLITTAVITARSGALRRLESNAAERAGVILEVASSVSIAVVGTILFLSSV
jgi:ABC-type nickel/cobalt efflux system permease component RcnA